MILKPKKPHPKAIKISLDRHERDSNGGMCVFGWPTEIEKDFKWAGRFYEVGWFISKEDFEKSRRKRK